MFVLKSGIYVHSLGDTNKLQSHYGVDGVNSGDFESYGAVTEAQRPSSLC